MIAHTRFVLVSLGFLIPFPIMGENQVWKGKGRDISLPLSSPLQLPPLPFYSFPIDLLPHRVYISNKYLSTPLGGEKYKTLYTPDSFNQIL